MRNRMECWGVGFGLGLAAVSLVLLGVGRWPADITQALVVSAFGGAGLLVLLLWPRQGV